MTNPKTATNRAIFRVESPDPAWLVSVQNRKAVLWIGPSIRDGIDDSRLRDVLADLVLHPWLAVVVDASAIPVTEVIKTHPVIEGLALRHYDRDSGPERLPPNRLPIYSLRGTNGVIDAGYSSDPAGLFVRLSMLRKVPIAHEVFTLGLGDAGAKGLREAQAISGAFSRIVVVDPGAPDLSSLATTSDVLFHWPASVDEFCRFLQSAPITRDVDERVLVRTPIGLQAANLSSAIDASYPITTVFELVPARAAVRPTKPTLEYLRTFLDDPAESWDPYAAGIPAPRDEVYQKELIRRLDHFVKEGPQASGTSWLTAEEGSGATALVRELALAAARQGYPVLVARPGVKKFDFGQLSAFLTKAADRFGELNISVPDLPWLIVFDAEHSLLHSDFVTGVAGGLRKLLRSTLVLAVKPGGRFVDESRFRARGNNQPLGPLLRNSVSSEEALAIGTHLSSFLPVEDRRKPTDWDKFAGETVRTTMEGRSSLFWVALRFWLFRLPGSGESLRTWLARKVTEIVQGEPPTYAGMLEVAALSRYRLAMPAGLLPADSLRRLREISLERSNPLGFHRISAGILDAFTFVHPLIAEEMLRIGFDDPAGLSAVEKQHCLSLLDLELHLFGRMIRRPAAGDDQSIDVIEELVTTGLRVDEREAPRNYVARERIVELLEDAPDALWDASQVFNHHLAKARRHLAMDPPKASGWDVERRREQLQFAENHLLDAIENIQPRDPERRESPLNLHVSLALTLDSRARLESEDGDSDLAAVYRQRAEQNYSVAQQYDADNSYVLENYARLKLNQAKLAQSLEERVTFLVDAISLLQWERQVLEGGYREEPILYELGKAFELLEQGMGEDVLTDLAQKGSEPAAVALAKLALGVERQTTDDTRLGRAEKVLRSVEPERVTWRTEVALYPIVSARRVHAFAERLELLRTLDGEPAFAWPLQLRLEYAILLFQVGDPTDRKKGKAVFQQIRDHLSDRTGVLRVPPELRFLSDPSTGFTERLLTSMLVKNVSNVGRNYYAIPAGWFNIDVPFRPYLFGDDIREGDERDCYIQFTNFGPLAVPPTTE